VPVRDTSATAKPSRPNRRAIDIPRPGARANAEDRDHLAPTPGHVRGHELMSEIVERAKRSGELRPDFVLADMAFVTWAITRTIEATGDVDPQAWRRHLGFVLDGLRAGAAHPLPVPALTDEQVSRIMRSC
jgi:hypothetical protein